MSSPGNRSPQGFERILVRVCNSKLGDLLMATPTLAGIREKYPAAQITLLLPQPSPGVWIECHPLIDAILWEPPYEKKRNLLDNWRLLRQLRAGRFDAVVDLRLRGRYAWLYWFARIPLRTASSTKYYASLMTHNIPFDFDVPDHHEVESNYGIASPLQLDSCPPEMSLPISPRDEAEARQLLASHGLGIGEPFVVLNPTFGGSSRLWPAERFAEAACGIHAETGLRIVVIGGPAPQGTADPLIQILPESTVDLRGQTSIPVLAALLRSAALHVSVDTGTSHLAATMQTPCVTIFTFFEYWEQRTRWQPWRTPLRTVGPRTRCASCKIPHGTCKRDESTCIDSVCPAEVVQAAVELLQESALPVHQRS